MRRKREREKESEREKREEERREEERREGRRGLLTRKKLSMNTCGQFLAVKYHEIRDAFLCPCQYILVCFRSL